MSDMWAGILAISMAAQALVQVAVLIGVLIAVRRIAHTAQTTRQRVDALVSDVQGKLNLVVTDVRGVTGQVSEMVGEVRHRAHRVEESVRSAGQRVADAGHRVAAAVEQVPRPVKQGVPAAIAVLGAYRAFREVQQRMRQRRVGRAAEKTYAAS